MEDVEDEDVVEEDEEEEEQEQEQEREGEREGEREIKRQRQQHNHRRCLLVRQERRTRQLVRAGKKLEEEAVY
jgi:hypothetical protein